jgi:hypothetical protein
MAVPGVFCVEGQWEDDLSDRVSVRPTLELLERLGAIQFIHKTVATAADLDYFLDRWLLRAYSGYQLAYFAMHGSASTLNLSRRHSVTLHHIAQQLDGRCEGRQMYFGSCSVLQASDDTLRDFLKATKAELICGYTTPVDWFESAAFDTVLLKSLASGKQREFLNSAHWSALVRRLGFRIVYSDGRRR